MDKSFVNNYLLTNGKYFYSYKLATLGRILEESQVSEYIVNKRFLSPVTMTVLFWVFVPLQLIDRLILRDWFWGWLKLFLTPVWVLSLFFLLISGRDFSGYMMEKYTFEGFNVFYIFVLLFAILFALWTIIDGFTIYRRTKKANYKTILKTLNINYVTYVPLISNKMNSASYTKSRISNFEEWKKVNPNSSIKEYLNSK